MLSDGDSAWIQAGATITGGLSLLASGFMLLLPLFAIGPRSLQYAMVRTLAAFNLVEAATFAVGRAFIPEPGAAVSAGCRAQGAIMQLSSGASFVWILFFCLVLVRSAGESTAPRVGMSRPACSSFRWCHSGAFTLHSAVCRRFARSARQGRLGTHPRGAAAAHARARGRPHARDRGGRQVRRRHPLVLGE